MKKILFITAVLGLFSTTYAQESVTNRNGKEITVNADASSSTKGIIKLAGDLGGTADSPTVPALTNKLDGTGTLNYVPKFSATKTLTDSQIFDDGTNVGIGTTTPANKLEITQGTAGNSGLRFTNLNSSSTATTSLSKVLAVDSSGDVILTNVPGTQNIVAFSTATPTTSGVVFTPNTPADQSVVYQSNVDNSMWTYNGSTYVTYTAPASTAWYTSGTTNDAGNSKTSNIYRTGNVGIGTNNPSVPLDVQNSSNSTYVATAKFLAPNNTTAGNSTLLNFGVTNSTGNSADWRYVYQGNGSGTNRVDFGMSGYTAPMISYLNSGNVGIGTTAPVSNLHIQNATKATATINADAQMIRLSRPITSTIKWDNIAQFNLGSYSTAINANTRLDLAMNDGGGTTTSNVMTWQANGNVGIGTTAPTGQLEVATTNAFSAIIRRANNTFYTSANLILQKTYNTDPAVSTKVESGDYIGRILFSASNGTTTYPSTGPDIVGYAYGTQSATTNGGGMVFRTVKDATSTVVERLKIDHNGNVGIGVTPPSSTGTLIGSPAAILDIKSDNSGVLVPRMTTTQRTAITLTTALKGMLVFDSDVNMFYYNVGTSWSPINVGTIKTITATYTLLPEDNGRVLDVTSATAMTITVPSTLPVGFQVSITQAGAGQVTFAGGSGMTVNNRYSATKTSGQWAKAGLEVRASGSAVLSGDVQ